MSDYELLAPVGDFRNLRAAVEAGCDAVYFGIRGFNMRDTARNFELKDLGKIRRICGDKIKMYLTLNVVVYDGERKRVREILEKVRGRVDAVICWDFFVIQTCRELGIPFHVSTQASISNVDTAKFYESLGAERIVLARELSLKQISKISKEVDLEIECFCHGAMCVAVSGRCFMSQHLTNCSANRGKCLQFCRRSWEIKDDRGNELRLENSRVMSAKDLCTLPFVDRMKKAGIVSFKIEGRNRGPEYVKVVVEQYRRALDGWPGIRSKEKGIREGLEELKKVYNRGFSSGFYLGVPTSDDFSFSEHGEQKETKRFVGKVYKYWPKPKSCSLKVNAGTLKVGDEVYLISDEMGVVRSEVLSIEFRGKGIEIARKGDDVGVRFVRSQVAGRRSQDLGRIPSGVEVYVIERKV